MTTVPMKDYSAMPTPDGNFNRGWRSEDAKRAKLNMPVFSIETDGDDCCGGGSAKWTDIGHNTFGIREMPEVRFRCQSFHPDGDRTVIIDFNTVVVPPPAVPWVLFKVIATVEGKPFFWSFRKENQTQDEDLVVTLANDNRNMPISMRLYVIEEYNNYTLQADYENVVVDCGDADPPTATLACDSNGTLDELALDGFVIDGASSKIDKVLWTVTEEPSGSTLLNRSPGLLLPDYDDDGERTTTLRYKDKRLRPGLYNITLEVLDSFDKVGRVTQVCEYTESSTDIVLACGVTQDASTNLGTEHINKGDFDTDEILNAEWIVLGPIEVKNDITEEFEPVPFAEQQSIQYAYNDGTLAQRLDPGLYQVTLSIGGKQTAVRCLADEVPGLGASEPLQPYTCATFSNRASLEIEYLGSVDQGAYQEFAITLDYGKDDNGQLATLTFLDTVGDGEGPFPEVGSEVILNVNKIVYPIGYESTEPVITPIWNGRTGGTGARIVNEGFLRGQRVVVRVPLSDQFLETGDEMYNNNVPFLPSNVELIAAEFEVFVNATADQVGAKIACPGIVTSVLKMGNERPYRCEFISEASGTLTLNEINEGRIEYEGNRTEKPAINFGLNVDFGNYPGSTDPIPNSEIFKFAQSIEVTIRDADSNGLLYIVNPDHFASDYGTGLPLINRLIIGQTVPMYVGLFEPFSWDDRVPGDNRPVTKFAGRDIYNIQDDLMYGRNLVAEVRLVPKGASTYCAEPLRIPFVLDPPQDSIYYALQRVVNEPRVGLFYMREDSEIYRSTVQHREMLVINVDFRVDIPLDFNAWSRLTAPQSVPEFQNVKFKVSVFNVEPRTLGQKVSVNFTESLDTPINKPILFQNLAFEFNGTEYYLPPGFLERYQFLRRRPFPEDFQDRPEWVPSYSRPDHPGFGMGLKMISNVDGNTNRRHITYGVWNSKDADGNPQNWGEGNWDHVIQIMLNDATTGQLLAVNHYYQNSIKPNANNTGYGWLDIEPITSVHFSTGSSPL